jgi:23S rRNA (guanosine2251-2'-O)-methyltransferase
VLALVTPSQVWGENMLEELLDRISEPPLLLVLDGVTDPHNLGACLRTADAAGVHAVIIPKDKSATLNATVRKVACGAAEVVPLVAVTNLSRTLQGLQKKGIWIAGTAGEAETSIYQQDLRGPLALVMGAEGQGHAPADPRELRLPGQAAHAGFGQQPQCIGGNRGLPV